jgi:hypothetical protein
MVKHPPAPFKGGLHYYPACGMETQNDAKERF